MTFVFENVVSREPDPQELEILNRLLKDNRREYQKDPDSARKLMQQVGSRNADIPVEELAAWTMVCRALLNVGEGVMRY